MTKGRVVIVEIEGDDGSVFEALRGFAAIGLPGGAMQAPAVETARVEAPREIAAPVAAPARPAKVQRRGGKRTSTATSTPATDPEPGGAGGIVLQLLAKGPMSSADLIRKSGRTSSAIYTALTTFRKQGKVVSVEDPGSPYKLNKLAS